MPSFADSIFLFVLALLLFGPKKLPVLARELGKWMGEFRRASNEFKMQMEDELRTSEQAERKQQIAAMEAAAPVPPPLGEPAEPEHPHLRTSSEPDAELYPESADAAPDAAPAPVMVSFPAEGPETVAPAEAEVTHPLPIATSGSLHMMPPDTGLPMPRSGRGNALSGLVDSIPDLADPSTNNHHAADVPAEEGVTHGD